MTKTYCDRCGQETDKGFLQSVFVGKTGLHKELLTEDLCDECVEALRGWIRGEGTFVYPTVMPPDFQKFVQDYLVRTTNNAVPAAHFIAFRGKPRRTTMGELYVAPGQEGRS